ncbi:hypothetical protein JYQ62_29755 [Nostoc sp. UHCC 0702]|nr:hypothetical protein JYQ62_29755 [Nostoc sp. UHCC 0702]
MGHRALGIGHGELVISSSSPSSPSSPHLPCPPAPLHFLSSLPKEVRKCHQRFLGNS